MKTRAAKWGNSLAIRLPKAVVSSLSLVDGTELELLEQDGGLLVRPAQGRYAIKDLVKGIHPANLHAEMPAGDRVGGEAW